MAFIAGAADLVLQFIGDVEVIFYGALVAPCDEGDVIHAGMERFLYPILDQRFGEDGQYFLGLRLGCGKEAGSIPCHREEAFGDHHFFLMRQP